MNNQEQIESLQQENKLMKKIATTQGFYQYFFSQLKNHRTANECFNNVNDIYFDFFGEYKYSSWFSFRSNKNYYENL